MMIVRHQRLIASAHRHISQRICEWFPNHSGHRSARNRANARATSNVVMSILMGTRRRRTRKLDDIQAYSRYKWPVIRHQVRAEWELEKLTLAPGTKLPGAYLCFMRRRLKELFAAESDEVKRKVEEIRNNPAHLDDPEDLHPHEQDLPLHEREELQRTRERQLYVFHSFHFDFNSRASSLM